MDSPIHTDAISAWEFLCKSGGIELAGRDEGLDMKILDCLNPNALSLEEALATATLEEFTRAFFYSICPYVQMFHDILDFFKNSNATKGKSQWILAVNGAEFGLEHFQEWLESWSTIEKAYIDIPVFAEEAISPIWNILLEHLRDNIADVRKNKPPNIPQDIYTWIETYRNDKYLPLPESLLASQCPEFLRPCASIVQSALQTLLNLNLTPSSLKAWGSNNKAMESSESIHDSYLRSISNWENDSWLETWIIAMAVAKLLPVNELNKLGEDIQSITDGFPIQQFEADMTINTLAPILSVPIWQKRYELFAVWIATEIIRALKDYDVEIHDDNGKIEFSFKETLIATIRSPLGSIKLLSERRIPLANESGVSNKNGAGSQPDYTLWATKDGEVVSCEMAVEVKHYKRPAPARFERTLEKYARAIPNGNVYLVNHGPVSKNLGNKLSADIRSRIFPIGDLTVSNFEAREELAKAVQECVGKLLPNLSKAVGERSVLLLDVSPPLIKHLKSAEELIQCIVIWECPSKLIAADGKTIAVQEPSDAGLSRILQMTGGDADLSEPVENLLHEYDIVRVITNHKGRRTLEKCRKLRITRVANWHPKFSLLTITSA